MRLVLFIGGMLLSGEMAFAQSPSSGPTYWQDIRPIFRKHCTACHSAKHLTKIDVSGGLALDTFEAAMKGSKQPVLSPGKSAKSLLFDLIITSDVKRRMPLESNPLASDKIELIKKWIDAGAIEGSRPVETTATTTTRKAATRKLNVLVPTNALVPAGTEGLKIAGKLELAMKIGPLAPVTAVAFSPDSKLLAAGSYGQVVVWDLTQGKPAKLLTNVLGAVNDLRFSPDGKILAVGGGQPSAKGDLRLYQVSDWKLLAALRGHDDVVFSLAFSPDGATLASASFDHTVRLWNVRTHEALKTFSNHSDFVYAVAFSPNGEQLASASKDRSVQLLDVRTGKGLFTFSGMEQDVMAVAFSPDGKTVVSSGFEPALYWWSTQTGEKIKTQGGHGIAVHEIAFSKDGKVIVSAGADRTVRSWDGATGAAIKTFPVGSVAYAVAISPNRKFVAAGSFDGLVRVWDEATARHLVSLIGLAGASDQPEWLAMTPEGFTIGSKNLLRQVRWRLGAQEVVPATLWSALEQPQMIAKALRGEALPVPSFGKK